MSLHAAVSGWLLGTPSGANRRLLGLLGAVGEQLTERERITVLHRPEFTPPELPRIEWHTVDIPTGGFLRRARREHRVLPGTLRELGVTVLDHALLPTPRVHVPTCLTVHDVRAADGHTRWPRFLARAILRDSIRRADVILSPSQWTLDQLLPIVPHAPRVRVVPNGVDRDAGPRDVTPPRPLPEHGFLLHVGHLEPRKNLAVVIKALAQIAPDDRPELWLVGNDAGEGDRLAALVERLAMRSFVHQLGAISDDELPDYYRSARLVVMPSRYEGFGMPALEGLAYGRPVLAANAGALPEVVGDVATMLPPDDPDAWREAILRRHPDTPTDRAARATMAQSYSWNLSAESWLRTLRELTS